MRILFIGNSHTYYNDMPETVRSLFVQNGTECEVTMLAHGGWQLRQHADSPDVRFNILYGHYDYVVLQERAHSFPEENEYYDAVRRICVWIREAGSIAVLSMTWARKDEPEKQADMIRIHRQMADELHLALAPVGQNWLEYLQAHPKANMYASDGAHASPFASTLAARWIFETICSIQ